MRVTSQSSRLYYNQQPVPISATQRLDTYGWSPLPLRHASHTLFTGTALITTVHLNPLRWCRQSEPFIFIRPGSANNNFSSPCRFRTAAQGRPYVWDLLKPPPNAGTMSIFATARLMRRGAAYKAPHMDDALSGIHRTSLEPRGGNEPPRPRRRSHGRGPASATALGIFFYYLYRYS